MENRHTLLIICIGFIAFGILGIITSLAVENPSILPWTPKPLPKYRLESSYGSTGDSYDPCIEKEYCLVAFVAPWCPSCHNAIPFIKDVGSYLSNYLNVGFKLIVGSDKSDKLISMGQSFGGLVYYDTYGEFQEAVGFGSVPHWILLNEKGAVIDHTGAGGLSGAPTKQKNVELFLERIFPDFWETLKKTTHS